MRKVAVRSRKVAPPRAGTNAFSLTAELPGSRGPLWRMQVEVNREPQGTGEKLRLRARIQMALPGAPALAAPAGRKPHGLPARVGHWLERRLQSPLAQRIAAPLLGRSYNTWIQVQASTAELDQGPRSLLPDNLPALGIEPDPRQPVQTWAGELRGGRPGFAMMTLLQLAKDQLPPQLQRRIGDQPLHVAAAVINTVEEQEG